MTSEITPEYFESLYKKKDGEKVIKLEDAPGITVIKEYPSRYKQENYRMFVRFYMLDNNEIYGGVNMVEESTKYIRENENFNNFYLNDSDKMIFDIDKNKIIIKRFWHKRAFTINQFVDLLTKNHLYNKSVFTTFKQKIKTYFLKLIFWFVEKKYDWTEYQREVNKLINPNKIIPNQDPQPIPIPKIQEPFFKYFHIHRRVLLIFMIIISGVLLSGFSFYSKLLMCLGNFMMIFQSEYFTVTNPILLLIFFIFLSGLHYFSEYLTKSFNDKKSFIVKIHYSLLRNTFKLKIYKV